MSNDQRVTVHHVRERATVKADIHIYCGRRIAPAGMINANLGNPFAMNGEVTRDEVCDKYENWLSTGLAFDHLRVMERIIQRINEGNTLALYCWCAPKRCHCDTIKEYVLTNVNFD